MENLVTTDSILNWFKENVKNKEVIDPNMWLDSARKLNVLISEEHDKLLELQQQVAQKKVDFINIGEPVARAKAKVEATDIYKEMNRQNAKIEQIEEHIRIAKIMARLKGNEYQNQ